MTQEQTIHQIGKRDALAELFMMIRLKEGDATTILKELAEKLPDNPHAKWITENLCQK